MQQGRDSFGITFYKNILTSTFLKFNAKRVPWPLGHIFNEVNRGMAQKADEVGTSSSGR